MVTKQDVEKHFKNAKKVKNAFNKEFDFSGVEEGLWGSFRDKDTRCTLYDDRNGFAEIVELKEAKS
jgi:hypothetical protein